MNFSPEKLRKHTEIHLTQFYQDLCLNVMYTTSSPKEVNLIFCFLFPSKLECFGVRAHLLLANRPVSKKG